MTQIQERLGVHPIFLPQQQFQDMFGKANAYLEMNPAMYITDKGKVCILVRCINYRKFQDKQFSLYEPKSNSRYFLLLGTVSPREPLDLETFSINEIQYSYNLPKYPAYWTGPEDIRFLDQNTVLAVIPELNSGGAPTIFKATLDHDAATLKNFQPCLPNTASEKNWMPFQTSDKVIYSLHPFTVKSVSSDDKEEIPTHHESLKGYHGSTNGIPYGNTELLFLIHANREKSYHRWLRYNPVEKSVYISEEFTFFKNTYIEFPCSLSEWNHTLYVGLGVNDDKAMIVEVSKYSVQSAKWLKA
jgi:hypothetical protein